MGQHVNRIEPAMPVTSYTTFGIRAPKNTHYRPGSCAEVDCPNREHGWTSTIDESTDLGRRQAHYIRRESGRRFTEHRTETGLTVFTFEPGQRCFTPHQVSLERPPLFVVRAGDWRGNPTGQIRQHTNADEWVDEFANHQDKLADRLAQG